MPSPYDTPEERAAAGDIFAYGGNRVNMGQSGGIDVSNPSTPVRAPTPGMAPTPYGGPPPATRYALDYSQPSWGSGSDDLGQARSQISDWYSKEIAGIKSYYDTLISQNVSKQGEINKENIGQTRSGLAATGRLGTTAGGEGALATTEQAGADAIAAIKATLGAQEQAAEASVFGQEAAGLQANEEKLLQASLAEKQKKIDNVNSSLEKMAASGAPFSSLDLQTRQKILDASGYTPEMLSDLYTYYTEQAKNPTGFQVTGSAAEGHTAFWLNPVTHQIETKQITAGMGQSLTPDEKNYTMGQSQGFQGTLQDWISQKKLNPNAKWTITHSDDFGNPVYGWVASPASQAPATAGGEKTLATPSATAGSSLFGKSKGTASDSSTVGDISADPTYKDFYASLPDPYKKAFESIPNPNKSEVMQLVSGDALLSDLAGKYKGGKALNTLINMAQKVDPKFSVNENKVRYSFKQRWSDPNGKQFITRDGMNTALYHLSNAKKIVDQLQNTDFMKYNSVAKWIGDNTNTEYSRLAGQLQDTVNLLSTEIARAYKGGVPDLPEITQQQNSLSATRPQDFLESIIQNKVDLMAGKLASNSEEYRKVMGKYPTDNNIDDQTIQALSDSGVDIKPVIDKLPIGSQFSINGTRYAKQSKTEYDVVP